MNNLKELAVKAKSRLTNKGLRTVYSVSGSSVAASGFFNDDKDNDKKKHQSESTAMKYLLREEKLMSMSPEVREKYILECIKKYQEERQRALFK